MRKTLVLLAALTVAGCSSGSGGSSSSSGTTSGGTDAGMADAGSGPTISVSGTVTVHPVAAALYDAGLLPGSPQGFAGQTLFIDEPLISTTSGVQAGRLATITLDGGSFSVAKVPTDRIIIGLVGTLAGESPDAGFYPCEVDAGAPAFCNGYARSVGLVYENGRPSNDVSGANIDAVPVSLAELLSRNLGEAQGNHLLDQGFVLGYVVDGQGKPVAGAHFDNKAAYDVEYLDDNLQPTHTDSGTNKYGMFLIVAPGAPNPGMTFGIVNHPEYKCHRVGSNPGTVFSLVYDPRHPGIACQ